MSSGHLAGSIPASLKRNLPGPADQIWWLCEFVLPVLDSVQNGPTPLPAITHVDGSARVQTINKDQDPLYYDLLKSFKKKTGCSVFINTSMNVRGEPIVNTPEDAYRCFMRTEMDALAAGPFVMLKSEQPTLELKSAKEEFGLD